MNSYRLIALKAVNGLYVSCIHSLQEEVIINVPSVGPKEAIGVIAGFYLMPPGGSRQFCILSSFAANARLTSLGDKLKPEHPSNIPNQQPENDEIFELVPLNGVKVAFKCNSGGGFLSAQPLHNADGSTSYILTKNAMAVGPSESFELTDLVPVYENDGFNGDARLLAPGFYVISDLKLTNNQINSFHIAKGMSVTLYENVIGESGRAFLEDTLSLGALGTTIKAIMIEKQPVNNSIVTVFETQAQGGLMQELAPGDYDISNLTIGKSIGAVLVPDGMLITLFDQHGCAGTSKTYFKTENSIDNGHGSSPLSIRVAKVPVDDPDRSTNVLQFDGVGTYCTAPIDVSETEYTASVWFNTTNKDADILLIGSMRSDVRDVDRTITLRDGFICTTILYNVSIQEAPGIPVTNRFFPDTIKSQNTFADGTWHKVTHVFGGAIGAQRLYVDGNLVATGTKSSSDFTKQDTITLGLGNDVAQRFKGQIAEVAIWSIARSEQAITAKDEVLTGTEPGLLAYWNFKDGFNNTITDRVHQVKMLVNGQATWATSVISVSINAIHDEALTLADTANILPEGSKINLPEVLPSAPLAQLISSKSIPQFDALNRFQAAKAGNKLTLSKDLLGDYAQVIDIVATVMDAAITVNNPAISFVKVTPGTSGEDGESLGDDLLKSDSLVTVQSVALHISGDAVIFSDLAVQLKYAEFSQLNRQPYGVLKFIINSSVGISRFLPGVPLLDGIEISSPIIILSSSGDVNDGVLDKSLVKGFNFFGDLALETSNNDAFKFIGNLLGISALKLQGTVDMSGSTPAYAIKASIPIQKYIVDTSSFKMLFSNATLGIAIKGKPLKPSLSVSNTIIVTLKKGDDVTDLVFTGGIKLDAKAITGSYTMLAKSEDPSGTLVAGEWKEPFGVPGITIRELALQIGMTYLAPFIDNIGIHGNMKIGDIDGSMSVLISTNDPDQFILAGATDHITIMQIMTSMSPPTFAAYQLVPNNVKNVLNSIFDLDLNNVKINIVPSAATIGQISFDEGVTIMGQMVAWGWHADVLIKIDETDGIEIRGNMDNLTLGGNVLVISGANATPCPVMNIKLGPKAVPDVLISGNIALLGLAQDLLIKADSSGLIFNFDRAFGEILQTDLACRFHDGNFAGAGSIVFKLNLTVPTIFGNIDLVDIAMNASASLQAGPNVGFGFTIDGSFSFYGSSITMPTLHIDVAVSSFQGVFDAVIQQIKDNAEELFKSVFSSITEWANAVRDGIVSLVADVAALARLVFNATAQELVAAYQTLGKAAQELAQDLKRAYGLAAKEVAGFIEDAYKLGVDVGISILKNAGYAMDQLLTVAKEVYNQLQNDAAILFKSLGYTMVEVGTAIIDAYNITMEEGAAVLKAAEYAAGEIAGFMVDTCNLTVEEMAQAFKNMGYELQEIVDLMSKTFGKAIEQISQTLKNIGYKLEEIVDLMSKTFGMAIEQISQTLKNIGYKLEDIGNTILSFGKTAAEDVAKILKGLEYEITDVANFITGAFKGIVNIDLAAALKVAGYLVDQVGDFFKELGPAALKDVLKGAGFAADETAHFLVSLGGPFEDLGNDILGGLKDVGDKLDPFNW